MFNKIYIKTFPFFVIFLLLSKNVYAQGAASDQYKQMGGVTGLTAAQQAEAVAKAINSAETGGMMSFGGDGQNKQLPQTTAQNTVQTYMDSLTENEIDRYNELIEQGYTDEYAKAYLGML